MIFTGKISTGWETTSHVFSFGYKNYEVFAAHARTVVREPVEYTGLELIREFQARNKFGSHRNNVCVFFFN